MTYIEFFDCVPIRNISTCLTYIPDRVIYIGGNNKRMLRHIANYKKVFLKRGYDIEFLCRGPQKNDLESAVTLLSEIVEAYDDCVFDITGGDEMLNVALGIVLAKYPDKNIQIHKFNMMSNVITDCDKDGVTVYRTPPKLTVEENIRIHGGDIVYGYIDENKTYKWELTPEFIEDVETIWSICKGDIRFWNATVGVFAAMEKIGHVEGMTTIAHRDTLDEFLARNKSKNDIAHYMINSLTKKNIINLYDDKAEKTIAISYKNEQVKRFFTLAGLILEMKIFLMAKQLCDSNGEPVYNDAMNGVLIDWDGVFHDETIEKECDVENEIDVLLMHDTVPVFVSCKAGKMTIDELYKLNTVAERFGGPYAKKVLITTVLEQMGDQARYIRQRATDMGIHVIEDVQHMEEAELEKKIKNMWCYTTTKY